MHFVVVVVNSAFWWRSKPDALWGEIGNRYLISRQVAPSTIDKSCKTFATDTQRTQTQQLLTWCCNSGDLPILRIPLWLRSRLEVFRSRWSIQLSWRWWIPFKSWIIRVFTSPEEGITVYLGGLLARRNAKNRPCLKTGKWHQRKPPLIFIWSLPPHLTPALTTSVRQLSDLTLNSLHPNIF